MGSIIIAGIVTSSIIMGERAFRSPRRAMVFAGCFAVLCLAVGRVLTPLGISKIRATPTWCLYSIGAAVIIFAALFWVCDVLRRTRWAFFVRPAGENTLATYLLPDLWYFLSIWLGLTFIDKHFMTGWPAVVKTFAFTFSILAVSGALTRWKVRLRF